VEKESSVIINLLSTDRRIWSIATRVSVLSDFRPATQVEQYIYTLNYRRVSSYWFYCIISNYRLFSIYKLYGLMLCDDHGNGYDHVAVVPCRLKNHYNNKHTVRNRIQTV